MSRCSNDRTTLGVNTPYHSIGHAVFTTCVHKMGRDTPDCESCHGELCADVVRAT
jgi:hypothetical protein